MRSFELDDDQIKKAEDWIDKKYESLMLEKDWQKYSFSYEFTLTGIGIVERVTCSDGSYLDLTDYSKW